MSCHFHYCLGRSISSCLFSPIVLRGDGHISSAFEPVVNSDSADCNPSNFQQNLFHPPFIHGDERFRLTAVGRRKLIFHCLAAFRVTFVMVVIFCILHLLCFAEKWLLSVQSLQWKQTSATPGAEGLQLVKQTQCRYLPRVKEPLDPFLSGNCASYCLSTGVFVDFQRTPLSFGGDPWAH